MSFEARLIPHRSTWDTIRLTCGPFLAAILIVMLALALESAAPAAAEALVSVSAVVFVVGLLYLGFAWRRGPRIAVTDGALALAARRAPVAELRASVGQYVFQSRSRSASGRFWLPLLSLRFPDGAEVRIVCLSGGARAEGRKTSPAPHYGLQPHEWEHLATTLDARPG
ncbi:hypothetical protein [Nannocystis pusilla]|uniref:Uncharacterized protein n=1 Tax=Nannocystis pusilla TaxID=889268 RepID=A0ABS7U6K0_9BACT|nr:hypothetical protein [Nannocystis pusilla]MBZ5715891.1 hypothetical protein [Nannocystis pusilla]